MASPSQRMQFTAHRKTLLRHLADGNFISGSDLATALRVSRTAVWKMMRELKALGLEFNAISGKGYGLARPLELLDENAIAQGLSPAAKSLSAQIEIHDELDSTNSRLLGMASATSPQASGTVCLAEFQTAGRGRVGRVWQTPFGGNICLSLLWWFDGHAAFSGLSLAVGVAIVRALRSAGVEGVGLKWPNDILWRGRKLGGILLEVSGEAHGCYAVVVGIGLNMHIPAVRAGAIDQAWTDLDHVTSGSPPSRNRLIALLLNELLPLLADYPERGLRAYLGEWRQWHCQVGQKAVLHLGDKLIRGVVAGVSDDGLLVLDCEDGGLRQFPSGDLRLRADD
jgi:BirA family biotin operon repressor/biotin-[acetyl-CoA-carboxylase] ligase